jgi:tetratricopeptide (TPR) repeat protein
MAYEELREKGNKKYNKGKFSEALDYYERALSLFRWLEFYENQNESRLTSEGVIPSEQSIDEMSERGSKINIEFKEEKKEQDSEDQSAGFDDLRGKYKEFFITYCDDNVKEWDGEDMTETADIDMRKSLLVQLYLNMAAAYIHLHHYSLA